MSGTEQDSRKRHLAARVLAGQAENAEELAVLLDMLGLSAAEGLTEPPPEQAAAIPPEPRRSVAEREAARMLSSMLLGAATRH